MTAIAIWYLVGFVSSLIAIMLMNRRDGDPTLNTTDLLLTFIFALTGPVMLIIGLFLLILTIPSKTLIK